jgi:hemin uptake protein HemP
MERAPPSSPEPEPASPASGIDAPAATRPPPLASSELFRGRRIVEISHNGEIYRLQATRLGKLILTK